MGGDRSGGVGWEVGTGEVDERLIWGMGYYLVSTDFRSLILMLNTQSKSDFMENPK